MAPLAGRRCSSMLAAVALSAFGCATSPTGRSQVLLYPEDEVADLGEAAFAQIQRKTPAARDPEARATVECVARRIVDAIPPEMGAQPRGWQVEVFADDTPNAFALPGGKIGVNQGMLNVAQNDAQLAAVIAHEVAHVLAKHTNERLSTTALAETGLSATSLLVGGQSEGQQALLAALGLGAQVGVVLPFSRTQESEADVIGLELMARAGFEPHEAVALWRNMQQAGGGEPPEFLSTHPSDASRIEELSQQVPRVMPLYAQAARENLTPCEYPSDRRIGARAE